MNAADNRLVEVDVAGSVHLVEPKANPRATIDGSQLFMDGQGWTFSPRRSDSFAQGTAASDGSVLSPMPGRIVSVFVKEGQSVAKGERLLVLEAMKMEQSLTAPFDGTVIEVTVGEGMQVAEGALLVRLEGGA